MANNNTAMAAKKTYVFTVTYTDGGAYPFSMGNQKVEALTRKGAEAILRERFYDVTITSVELVATLDKNGDVL